MNKEKQKEKLREKLGDYLEEQGYSTRKPFICINPDHDDHNPSMSYDKKNNRVHCFSAGCGASYDIFDVWAILHRRRPGENFLQDYKEVCAYFGELPEFDKPKTNYKQATSPFKEAQTPVDLTEIQREAEFKEEPKKSYKGYLEILCDNLKNTDYLLKRGISYETAQRLGVGYEDNCQKERVHVPYLSYIESGITFPTSEYSFNVRNLNPGEDKKKRYCVIGNKYPFNSSAINNDFVFVCEGEIDALSFEELGFHAIATCGTNEYAFKRMLETESPTGLIALCLDTDGPGQKETETLQRILNEKRLKCVLASEIIKGYKDPNEALTSDRDAFKNRIEQFITKTNLEIAMKEEESKENYKIKSAGGYLARFKQKIAESTQRDLIKTGFPKLDNALVGGLREGLYIIGGGTSTGKTTYCLQMADNIAKNGTDVLYFTIEMSQDELIGRSISRETYNIVRNDRGRNGLKENDARTQLEITEGKFYEKYTQKQRDLINYAMADYGKYASHMYIVQTERQCTPTAIKERLEEHISNLGNKPVIFVDYLQIMALEDEFLKGTNKENLDLLITGLKQISRDYSIPIIVISSLNRANYKTSEGMDGFSGSSGIEYGADVGIKVEFKAQQDWYKEKKGVFKESEERDKFPREMVVKIVKHRCGPTENRGIPYQFYTKYNTYIEE